jgi:hypothetical protein
MFIGIAAPNGSAQVGEKCSGGFGDAAQRRCRPNISPPLGLTLAASFLWLLFNSWPRFPA